VKAQPRTHACSAFDGWVTRADFRVGAKVWGQNGIRCSVIDADTTLIARDLRACRALATSRSGFWTISIRSSSSWHYHHKEEA